MSFKPECFRTKGDDCQVRQPFENFACDVAHVDEKAPTDFMPSPCEKQGKEGQVDPDKGECHQSR
jgi:hypothetical protein